MDKLQLQLFISISMTRSFTKTANKFYMTQPSVSNYIRALENDVGVKLINRDNRNVSLTPEGEEYIRYASQILTIQMEAENRLRNVSKGRSGYVKIAILSSTAELFSKCLAVFSKVQPNVQVDVYKMEGVEMMRAISLHNYDVYFANRYMVPDRDRIEFIVTGTEQLHLFVHKNIKNSIDINDWTTLKNYRFVSVAELDFALSGQIKNICSNRGVTPDVINYYNHADIVLLAVNSGIGMAILPPGLTYFYNFPNIISMPIKGEDAEIKPVIAWHKDTINSDAKSFLQIRTITRFRESSIFDTK
jgi:DNA-binding transcriptional LysR family regulator